MPGLLERPSYYSIHQVAGDIFSRPKALEIHRRAAAVQAAPASGTVPDTAPLRPTLPLNADKLTDRGLIEVCADPALNYVVSWSRLTPAVVDSVTPDTGTPMSQLHLYRCSGSSGP